MNNLNTKHKSSVTSKIGIFICLILFISSTFTRLYEITAQETQSCTWMKSVSNNTLLCNINIPGTHDSGTRYTEALITGIVASCQDDSITQQLNKGIRYLDLRVDTDMNINHAGVLCYTKILTISKYKLTLSKVLNKVNSFLKEHPSETVIVQIKKEGKENKNKDFVTEVNKVLSKYSSLYSKSEDINKLKLGDVRGKFIVFSRDKHPDSAYQYKGWPDNCKFAEKKIENSKMFLQDNYEAKSKSEKIDVIKDFYNKVWLQNSDILYSSYIINFISCVGGYIPEIIANKVNSEFEKFVKQNLDKKFGIVLMDVPNQDIISTIYNTNL